VNAAVIDASVVVRWLLDDDFSAAARKLATAPTQYIAPELLLSETANALWKAHRAEAVPLADAAEFLTRLPRRVEFPHTGNLIPEAFRIAAALNHPTYDCLYLALAEHLDLPFLTLDKRLHGRVAQTAFAARVHFLTSV
jgi:predicted nucleic acid-binding protein